MIKSFLIPLRNASPGPLTWFSIWSKFKEESHCCVGETFTSKLGHLCSEGAVPVLGFFLQWPKKTRRSSRQFVFFFLFFKKKKQNKPNIKIDRVSPHCCQQKCSVTCFLQCCLSGHFYWLGLKKCLEYFSCSHNLEELCCRMNREVSGNTVGSKIYSTERPIGHNIKTTGRWSQ